MNRKEDRLLFPKSWLPLFFAANQFISQGEVVAGYRMAVYWG